MSVESTPAPSRIRRAGVALISTSMLTVGIVCALTAGPVPVTAPFAFPGVLLLPMYLLALHRPLDFEYRRDAHSITLVQVPLALGTLLVTPWLHLAYRLAAAVIESVALRRLSPQKALYNVAAGAIEVGIAAAAVGMLPPEVLPGPMLWGALLAGVVVGDVVQHSALLSIFVLLHRGSTATELKSVLAVAFISSTVFTSVAVVAVSAAWTHAATMVLTVALAGVMGFFHRAYRMQSERERRTERLYGFVKGLGPIAPDSSEAGRVLEQVRVLLHCRSINLALCDPINGTWLHLLARNGAPQVDVHKDSSATSPDQTTPDKADPGSTTSMRTSLIGSEGLIGVLTAEDRLGSVRAFDINDVRLIEAIGAELSTAFDRGRLVSDLQRAATTDALTQAPNLNHTTQLIQALLDERRTVIVAAIAVDSFREVNDTLGHQVGDDLLVEVSKRLMAARPSAVVGRIGGGRFAVAVESDSVSGDAAMLGLELRAQVEGSADIGSVGTHVKISVGCAKAPEHGRDSGTLLRRAETAMYSARHAHGGPVVWEPAYEVTGQRRLALVTAMREALSTGAIGLMYQPKIDVASGVVTGVEALARWNHPALGPIRPDEFIPLAEASGLIGPLTTGVLDQALRACRRWHDLGDTFGVAVNVSADTVLEPAFIGTVASTLRAAGVEPQRLTLELTESVVLRDPEQARVRMEELRSLGVRLSIDDFGTGYSALTYLKRLPVHEVKVDKGFVDGLAHDAADRAVVRAVVDIAHTLKIRVVAEGVEDAAQEGILRALGTDEVQGYLHSRPLPEADLLRWTAQRRIRSDL